MKFPSLSRNIDSSHSSSWRRRYSRSFWKEERPIAEAVLVVVGEAENEIVANGCQRSFRRAGGTVFLPLKGS